MVKIEIVPIPYQDLSEGPYWDEPTKSLYFVDLFVGTIHKYTPSTQNHINKKISDDTVTLIIPVANKPNQFIVTEGLTLKVIKWDLTTNQVETLETLVTVPEDKALNRTNDGKCDAKGRLWFGTMAKNEFLEMHPKNGNFYSFTHKEGLRKILSDVGISNGIAWNKSNTKMFYIDSFKYAVDVMDFSLDSGKAQNRQTLFSFQKHNMNGLPDGMAVDTADNIWFAVHDNREILQIDSTNGAKLKSITVGAQQVTSVAFGGPELEDLYVTSGGKYKTPEEKAKLSEESGALYKISDLNAKGYPSVPFDYDQ